MNDTGPQLVIRRMSEIQIESIDWIWRPWLPRGKVAIYAGVEGDGKSLSIADLIARFTTRSPLPDGLVPKACNVLILAAEDGIADTIKPRLFTHKADMQRVSVVETVRHVGEHDERELMCRLAEHLPQLEDEINARGIDLVVIDPLSSYMQGSERNSEGEVRDLLTPLSRVADRTGAAILCIGHLNRPNGTSRRATQRILGSTAFGAVARMVWMLAPSPTDEDPNRRVLAVAKSNLAMKPPPLAWTLDGDDVPIRWLGQVDEDIDQLLAQSQRDRDKLVSPERQEIVDYLRDAGEPMRANDIAKALDRNPSTTRTLLTSMVDDGQLERAGWGVYATPDTNRHRQRRQSIDTLTDSEPKPTELSTLSISSMSIPLNGSVDSSPTCRVCGQPPKQRLSDDGRCGSCVVNGRE